MNKIEHKTQCTACGNVDLLQDSLIGGESVKILDEEKAKAIRQDAITKVSESMHLEMQDLKAQVVESKAKVQEANKIELASRKRERALKDQQANLDLELEKRLGAMAVEIKEKVKKEAEDEYRSTIAEMQKETRDIEKKLVETKRAIRRPSQQLQGETSEERFEDQLRGYFPLDLIEPVPKGMPGGDVIQTVRNDDMDDCGIIIHEVKETKTWSNKWINKLQKDVEAAGADIAILVTKTLPSGVDIFACVENIWIVEVGHAMPLIGTLRYALSEIAFAKNVNVNVEKRMEMLYHYLTSQKFRYAFEHIIQVWISMKNQLDKEKRVLNKAWKDREVLLESVTQSTIGMYADLKGIMGNKIEDIPELEMESIEILSEESEATNEAA
jgi:hypothetical protein